MTATVDNAVADLQRTVAELQRRLDETLAERDAAQERETATAEVLGVINASPGDLAPVFEAMLEKAMRLCEAAFGGLFTYDGEFYRSAAQRNLPPALMDAASSPIRAQSAGGALTAVANGEHLIHIADIIDTEDYRAGVWSRLLLADAGGARTALWIALRKDDVLRGLFVLYRTEVRPFTGKEIALVRNFAAQAVIAMENARLITETREALAQQTATADVLSVMWSPAVAAVRSRGVPLERAERLRWRQYFERHPKRSSRCPRGPYLSATGLGVPQRRDARQFGNQLAGKFEPFPDQLRQVQEHPRNIAAGTRQACDPTGLYGVAFQVDCNQGDVARCIRDSPDGAGARCKDDIDLQPHQFGGELG
jgi:hypothetical protein